MEKIKQASPANVTLRDVLIGMHIYGIAPNMAATDDLEDVVALANQIVERAPVPILGFIFVLIGESQFRIFKFLSWLSLLGGVLYFLLIPLSISAIVRIDQQSSGQISTRLDLDLSSLAVCTESAMQCIRSV